MEKKAIAQGPHPTKPCITHITYVYMPFWKQPLPRASNHASHESAEGLVKKKPLHRAPPTNPAIQYISLLTEDLKQALAQGPLPPTLMSNIIFSGVQLPPEAQVHASTIL